MKCISLMFYGNQLAVCLVNRELTALNSFFCVCWVWIIIITKKPRCRPVVKNVDSGARSPEASINHLFSLGQLLNLSDLDVLIHRMGVRMLGRVNELRYVKCLEQLLTWWVLRGWYHCHFTAGYLWPQFSSACLYEHCCKTLVRFVRCYCHELSFPLGEMIMPEQPLCFKYTSSVWASTAK